MVSKEDFKTDLEVIALRIKNQKNIITNENTTKQALIDPFIRALGYDTSNAKEVQAEFVAAWLEKKNQRVDYAIFKDNDKDKDKIPIIFIEAKPVGKDLVKDDAAQLAQYFNAYSDTKVAILTNGEVYWFFTDSQKPNVMDKIPFQTVNFSNLKKSDFEFLIKFKKENYNKEKICSIAEELYYQTAITETFNNLIKNPSDPFIDFLFKSSIQGKVLSPKIRQMLKPIVERAISNSISEIIRLAIIDMQQNDPPINPPPKPTDDKKDKITPPIKVIKPVLPPIIKITKMSKEETKAFEMVKSILLEASRDISNLQPNPTPTYLAIDNRVTTNWFLRLFLKKSVYINVRFDIPNIESLTKEFEITKYPKVTKIVIKSIEDLKKLDKLIVVCFDEVYK